MAHRLLLSYALCLNGCTILSAVLAVPSQAAQVPFLPSQTSATSRESNPDICYDTLFYVALPGKTNYCLGLRDWKHGHYRNGMELLKLAAGWGNKSAQYTLGLIYYGGRHVAPNPALGIAWLMLADQRYNDPQIKRVTQSAIKWATPTQQQQAKTLYLQMLGKYGDKVAAVRAWHHLQHWKFNHGPWASGCIKIYPAQAYALSQAHVFGTQVSRTFDVTCIPTQVVEHIVHKSADHYFRGLFGTVTVGPLQAVPAPATSTEH